MNPTRKPPARRERPARLGLRVERRFTRPGADPLGEMAMERRAVRIAGADGTVHLAAEGVEVPAHWDQTATDILAAKYLRRTGVPQRDEAGELVFDAAGAPVLGAETSLRQVARRLAGAWRHWGERAGYFASAADAEAYHDEMVYMIAAQMGAPNTPQWFNTGLYEAYGIVADPDGNWYYDEEAGEARRSSHRYERSAASACYIQRVEDRLVGPGSIYDYIENEARLFKAGSGSGANLSMLRAAGEALSGGGVSSGLMGFMRVADRSAGAIKSGGTTRRAARMVILDADHPEIEDFIWAKAREEDKVAALIAAGYDGGLDGEAYDTVAFQNANHSVRLPAGFLDAVAADGDWDLTARTTGEVLRTVRARELWESIAAAAWRCADPGVQFYDVINDWNPAADTERLRGTNPCAEYVYVDESSCNLASLNLAAFYDPARRHFDVEAFEHAVRLWTLTLEITVTMAHYPTASIATTTWEHRPLGLGYANLGALVMRAGLAYDSPEARAVMGAVAALLHNRAYATSAEIAEAHGPCAAWAPNRASMARVLANHRRAAYGTLAAEHGVADYQGLSVTPPELDHQLLSAGVFANLSPALRAAADEATSGTERAGYANMQVSATAPTGTIALVMSCDTTGIEPDFALVKHKKLAGGGMMRIVNRSVPIALDELGYAPEARDAIVAHIVGTRRFDDELAARLRAAGLEAAEIEAAEAHLVHASELAEAFDASVIGEAAYGRAELEPGTGRTLLAALGLDASALDTATRRVCGHGTIDGAPGLDPAHRAVFDTAIAPVPGGRSISWRGHVAALGAVAAHVSGSVSKTVNLPAEATVADVRAAYELAYELGVKCAAVYRDGSKLVQPLNTARTPTADPAPAPQAPRTITPGMSPTEYYHGDTPPRFRLPEMRYGPTWRLEVGGQEIYLRAGEYPDGTLGEVFVDWGKQGSTLRGMTAALAITISQGLQHGVPLAKLVAALRGHQYEPSGVVAGHANVKMATSVVDAVMRTLGYFYLGDDTLVQVPSGPVRADLDAPSTPPTAGPSADSAAPPPDAPGDPGRLYGLTCASCGSDRMRQSGSCRTCESCGATTGCS